MCHDHSTQFVPTRAGLLGYDVTGCRAPHSDAATGTDGGADGGRVDDDAAEGGPTIVLLPSGAHTRSDFDGVRPALAGVGRTIALDWPGHGASPAPDRPAEMSAMVLADAVEDAVAALAPGGAVLVGNSVGGYTAARIAIRRPDLVRGLVLVDSGGFSPADARLRIASALLGRPGFLRTVYPRFARRYLGGTSPAERAAATTAVRTVRDPAGGAVVAAMWRSFAHPEHDLRHQASQIVAPTLLVWGRRDPVIPVRVAREAQRLLGNARLVTLDAGHVPHVSAPAEFAAAVVPFVRALGATVRTPGGQQ